MCLNASDERTMEDIGLHLSCTVFRDLPHTQIELAGMTNLSYSFDLGVSAVAFVVVDGFFYQSFGLYHFLQIQKLHTQIFSFETFEIICDLGLAASDNPHLSVIDIAFVDFFSLWATDFGGVDAGASHRVFSVGVTASYSDVGDRGGVGYFALHNYAGGRSCHQHLWFSLQFWLHFKVGILSCNIRAHLKISLQVSRQCNMQSLYKSLILAQRMLS